MMETMNKHLPYSHELDSKIESELLKDGYHLEMVNCSTEQVTDTYVDDDGHRFVLGKDNTTGCLIAKDQS